MDISFAGFTLKMNERLVVGPSGYIDLGARAIDVLCALIVRPEEVVSKDALLSAAWSGVVVEENALQAQISALRKALGAGLITTVHGRGYKYTGPPPEQIAPESGTLLPLMDRKPVVAVLPFANLSGDPEQQYFSDGVTEDIIDSLSRFRMLDVIGWYSAAAFPGSISDYPEIRRRLHADYVVTGSVKRSAGRIRIAVRLNDILRETVLWAERYDRELENVFALQDEVAAVISSRLSRHVEVDVAARVRRKSELSSYELVLKGMKHFRMELVDGHRKAAECFRKALEINPDCVEAMRGLSGFHISRWLLEFDRADLEAALNHARRGSDLDPSNADCFACLGLAQTWAEGVDAAASAFRRAIEINPGDSYVLADASVHASYAGQLTNARALLDTAKRLNPIPPRWFAEYEGLLNFAEGRFTESAGDFSTFIDGKYQMTYFIACLGHTGDRSALAKAASRVREHKWDLMAVAKAEPYREPTVREVLVEGLKRAMST